MIGSLKGMSHKDYEYLTKMYRRHAALMGFSFKKYTSRREKTTNELTEKYLACSCEGWPKSAKAAPMLPSTPALLLEITETKPTRKRKQHSVRRCGCKAQLIMAHDKEKQLWVVKVHDIQHNHDLTRTEWHHLHRVERSITSDKGKVIECFEKAGLRPAESFRFILCILLLMFIYIILYV